VVKHIDAIYSSPLERARETAAPLAKARGMAVRIDKGLLELDIGDWTGRQLRSAQRDKQWKLIQRWPSGFRFPGGESFAEMQTRMSGTLARLRAAHPGGVIVAVSHADPIKAATIDALGAHLDFFQRLSISPASVTAITYLPAGPMVLTLNSLGSLAELAPS
jgi:probable phosphoglycerate mutase